MRTEDEDESEEFHTPRSHSYDDHRVRFNMNGPENDGIIGSPSCSNGNSWNEMGMMSRNSESSSPGEGDDEMEEEEECDDVGAGCEPGSSACIPIITNRQRYSSNTSSGTSCTSRHGTYMSSFEDRHDMDFIQELEDESEASGHVANLTYKTDHETHVNEVEDEDLCEESQSECRKSILPRYEPPSLTYKQCMQEKVNVLPIPSATKQFLLYYRS